MGACAQSSGRVATILAVEIRPATRDDLDGVVALLAAQGRAATGVAGIRRELVLAEWDLPSFQIGRDNLVAESGGKLAGYAAVGAGQGLTLAATDDGAADELLDRIAARARERGFGALHLVILTENDPRAALVRRRGFELQTETILMWRLLRSAVDRPEWPDGVTVRTFEPADAAAVHALLDEAYRAWDRHYVPIAHDDWVRWMTGDSEFDPSVWWLAERDGALAGCALHWSSGWLKDLAVRASERGRGIGAALVETGFAEFTRRGLRRVGLKVDADNPTGAIRLYERLGFKTERREGIWALSL
jgi:ribosomal protein S18 acetylase RimI-like enzyme